MIVVFDTNVLIPVILQASRSARLFSRLEQAGHEVATSPQILQEVRETMLTKESLRKWLNTSDEEIEAFLVILPTVCSVVPGVIHTHGAVPADADDDKIIAAAIESNADYIISEDRHLLRLKEYEGIVILNRNAFAAVLDHLGVPPVE